MHHKNGFTLIEVIFVMGVLAVLIVLSAPIKISLLDNQKEQQFLATFENDLLYMQSITYLTPDNIGMDIKADSYTIIKGGLNKETVLRRSIPTDWSFDMLTLQGALISFNRFGTIRQPGAIHLTTNKSTYKIVFPLGKGRCYIEKL